MCAYSTENEHDPRLVGLGHFDVSLDESSRDGRDAHPPHSIGGGVQFAGRDSRLERCEKGFSHQLDTNVVFKKAEAGETPAPRGALADKPPVAQEPAVAQESAADERVSGEPADDLAVIRAGWAEEAGEGCVALDPAAVLRANRRSFALRVRGQSMIGAGICDGDIVVGEFTPEAKPGAIVVALIDGESTLKRFIMQHGKAYLASENPNYPDLVPLSELVIQGVVHTVVRRAR